MPFSSSNLIQPLKTAEQDFLEVLVTRFSLKRTDEGSMLEVSFDESTDAIWSREGRNHLRSTIPDFKRKAVSYQKDLDNFLVELKGNDYRYNDSEFPFRYISGGTLPIVGYEGKQYFCLFYRGAFPIGWNIANGGSDTRMELLDPMETVERELSEELIIINPEDELRVVFEREAGKSPDHPDFAVARRFWQEILCKQGRFTGKDLSKFEEVLVPLNWLNGSDSLQVNFPDHPIKLIDGYFLNINAQDFGIEVDKVAKIHIGKNDILCDGEVIWGKLLNRPIGLFDINKVVDTFDSSNEFFPDIFFWNGQKYAGSKFLDVLNNGFLPYVKSLRPGDRSESSEYKRNKKKFDLCPVTRRIIKRYLNIPQTSRKPGRYDVFISVGGEDVNVADTVHNYFAQKGINAYYYREPHSDSNFLRLIDKALDSASCLVAIGSKPENLERGFVDYELNSFFYDTLTRENKKANKMISYISDAFHPADLPRPLRLHTCIKYKPSDYKSGLPELLRELNAKK
jgi:hypothetical protein